MEDESNDFEMNPVVGSSRVKAIGHSGTTLRVEFPNGRLCEYENVPEHVYVAVRDSPSVGAAFGNLIVNGGYPFKYV